MNILLIRYLKELRNYIDNLHTHEYNHKGNTDIQKKLLEHFNLLSKIIKEAES